jgi:small subunit ribosomal protein S21
MSKSNKHYNQNNGLFVAVKDGNVEKALKQFKKKLKKANLTLEIQKHEFYEKPSAIKRKKKIKSITRNKYNKIVD